MDELGDVGHHPAAPALRLHTLPRRSVSINDGRGFNSSRYSAMGTTPQSVLPPSQQSAGVCHRRIDGVKCGPAVFAGKYIDRQGRKYQLFSNKNTHRHGGAGSWRRK